MKRFLVSLPYLFVMLLLCASSCQDNPVSSDRDLALSGRVLDQFTQEPISGAVVQMDVLEGSIGRTLIDTTNLSGRYSFDSVDPNNSTLTARHDSYCPSSQYFQTEEAKAQHDLLLNNKTPQVWDGWIKLDSIKVSCDNRPANYNFQYRCRLEDKQLFHATEFIAFYVSAGYKLHYAHPIGYKQGVSISLTFGNGHKTTISANSLENDDAYDRHIDVPLESILSGEELQQLGLLSADDLQPELAVWYRYQECGRGEEREGTTLLQVDFAND